MSSSFHDLFSDIEGIQKKSFEKGDVLFRQGDPAELVYFVESGELQLIRYTSDGHTVCLHSAVSGESFAEASLFTDIYHCNGEAAKNSIIWSYPRKGVLKKINHDKRCMESFYSLLAGQIRHMRFLMELKSIRSASERVLQYFRAMADEKNQVTLTHSLYNTAKDLGMAHETFYRTVAKLEKSGHLSRIDKRNFILHKI
jgi:CRP-like cAMP-binding protein